MITYQLITITTVKGRQLHVHLDERSTDLYKCLISEFSLGPTSPGAAIYSPFTKGESAEQAFDNLIKGIEKSLYKMDPNDSISEVDSDGDYLISKDTQSKYLQSEVLIKLHGE